MSKIVTIKPSPLSQKFTSIIGQMEKVTEKVVNGRTEYRSLGAYKQQRLPNSNQVERPVAYSSQKRKWMLKKYPDNSKELNTLVKRCNLLNDMPKHPEYGMMITECDIYNINDPFFNNMLLKITFTEGEGVLKLDNPKDAIMYEGALANSRFQISGDKLNPALTGRAKYVIVDKDIDSVVKKESRNRKKQAIALFDAMTDERKLTIAMAMGLIKDERTDSAIVEDVLWEAVEDDKTKYADTNTTKQEYFIKTAESDVEDLNIRKTIQKAITAGVLKRDKELGYTAFGGIVGKDKQQVIAYLLKPENTDTLFRIEKALENLINN